MKNRCLNPNASDFQYYGGRGVTLAPAWTEFDGFVKDMGIRPEGMTLERKDSKLGYTKDNCVWASRLVQSRNRDYTLNLEFNGETLKTWEWAEKLNLKLPSFHMRLFKYRQGDASYASIFQPNLRTS